MENAFLMEMKLKGNYFPHILTRGIYDLAEEKLTVLDDVVVTGTKTPHSLQDVPVETVVITAEDIEKKNAGNIMDLLKDIPGIQTANHDDVFGTYTWRSKMRGLESYGMWTEWWDGRVRCWPEPDTG